MESAQTEAIERTKEATPPAKPRSRRRGVSDGKKAAGKEAQPRGKRNAELGRKGEDAAARFLERRGYDILARNWTCAVGEADIVACDESTLVFVEVKTRSDCDKGLPEEAVGTEKRKRYEKIAHAFLKTCDIADVSVRFDVVAIVLVGSDRAFMRHHIDAFGVE